MTAYVTFEGRIEPVRMGRAIYTVLRLPPEVMLALGPARRVEGEIAEHPVNLAPSRMPEVDGPFLWTGKSLLAQIGVGPGDPVEVRLRPAPDDAVDLPDDLAATLMTQGALAAWQALTPGRRRGLLHQIGTARTAPTRAKRIARLIQDLTA